MLGLELGVRASVWFKSWDRGKSGLGLLLGLLSGLKFGLGSWLRLHLG